MSTLKTNNIQHVDLAEPSILLNSDGSVSIAGTVSYEDATNVDSVGVVTARKQLHVGTGVSVKAGGLNVTAGITTLGSDLQVQGDVSIVDKIYHAADTNTMIRFPAADTFTVETGGSERLRVTSDGTIGQGLTSPEDLFHISTAENAAKGLRITNTNNSQASAIARVFISGGDNAKAALRLECNGAFHDIFEDGNGHLTFVDNGSEKLRLDSSGRLLLGTTTEGEASADDLTIAGSSNVGITIRSGTSNYGLIYFSDATSGTAEYDGSIEYKHSDNFMVFRTGASERLRIDSSGRLLIGTTNGGYADADDFNIATSAHTGMTIRSGTSSLGTIAFSDGTSGQAEYKGFVQYNHSQDTLHLGSAHQSKATINADGNTNFVGIVTATEFIPTVSQLSHRNRIINGNMRIAQRATTSTSNGIKTVDRWDTHASGMDQLAFTQKRVTDSPNGHAYSYEIDITTAESAQAGDEYMRVQQKIEAQDLQYLAYGTSDAKTVTVSFWVKAYQTGTYVVNFYAQDGNRQITRTYTINASATWEYKSVTIPGDTSGTINNDTGAGIHLAFIIIADSGYRTTDSTSWINYSDGGYGYGQGVNVGSSTNNYWKITGVQFEQGSQPTPYENQRFDDILFACQRYYCELGRRINFDGTAATGDSKYSFIGLQAYNTSSLFGTLANFPRKMRAKPTVTTIGHIKYSNKSGGNIYAPNTSSYGAITHETVGTSGIAFDTNHFIQGGFACGFTDNDNASYNYITADAEI